MVVELDGNQNNVMKQSLTLESGEYILTFHWAARSTESNIETSAMSLYWNDQKIFDATAKDNSLRFTRLPIIVTHPGDYVLEIRGEG